jgi:hypothetical protein
MLIPNSFLYIFILRLLSLIFSLYINFYWVYLFPGILAIDFFIS